MSKVKYIVLILFLILIYYSSITFHCVDYELGDYNTPGCLDSVYNSYTCHDGDSCSGVGRITLIRYRIDGQSHGYDDKIKVIYKCSKKLHKPIHSSLMQAFGYPIDPGKDINTYITIQLGEQIKESTKKYNTITIKDELEGLRSLMKTITKCSKTIKYIGTSLVEIGFTVYNKIFDKKSISKHSLEEKQRKNEYVYTINASTIPNKKLVNNTGEKVHAYFGRIKSYEIYLVYEFRAEFHKKKIYDEDDGKYTEKYTFLGYKLVQKYVFLQDYMNLTEYFFKSVNTRYPKYYYSNSERIDDDENICLF